MCNLYSIYSNREAMRRISNLPFTEHASAGNLPPQPSVFPDYPAPVIRRLETGAFELARPRWGMPSPPFVLEGKKTDPGVTNVRNLASPHWRRWTGLANRCVVPFISFSEFDSTPGPDGKKKGDTWFAFDESRPLAFFAGIWVRDWTSTRKVKEGEVTADLFAFLTSPPNDVVGAIHMKAMPVILTTPDEIAAWMSKPWDEVKALQRPLPDGVLKIVGVGRKQDQPD